MVDDSGHFDRVAETYHRARPAYPTEIFDELELRGALTPGCRILELGAGTGQATAELLARGAHVTAVEPGATMAARLRAAFPTLEVIESTAEEAEVEPGSFDTVVAATSLHWMDLDVVLPRVHRALRPEGWLAAWWNVFGDPEVRTPFRQRIDTLSLEAGLSRDGGGTRAFAVDERLATLTAGGFAAEPPTMLRWTISLTSAQLRDLFTTFPQWAAVPGLVDRVAEAADECGGLVEEHYVSALYVARRRD